MPSIIPSTEAEPFNIPRYTLLICLSSIYIILFTQNMMLMYLYTTSRARMTIVSLGTNYLSFKLK